MYTSFLSLSLVLTPAATPAWQPDYGSALDLGQKQAKPVAVFVGYGPGGAAQLVKEGQLSQDAAQLLADKYVCVYVDQTNGGARLARDLGISQGAGLVISDRTGGYQAFHHDGKLAQAELTQRLRQFADPQLVVTRTVTNAGSRVSYYPESGHTYAPAIRTVNC